MQTMDKNDLPSDKLDLLSDEVSILDLLSVIKEHSRSILLIAIIITLISIAYALILPPVYKVTSSVVPAENTSSSGQSMSALSGVGGLGGLAGMAGINLSQGQGATETSLAIMNSRVFLEIFLEKYEVLPYLYSDSWDNETKSWKEEEPKIWSAVNTFRNLLRITRDFDSGVINLSLEWNDPVIAAYWVNKLIEEINFYLKEEVIEEGNQNMIYLEAQLKKTKLASLEAIIYNLMGEETKQIMLANVSKDYAFKVLDPAVVPLERIAPRRRVIVTLGVFLGFIFGLAYAFMRSFFFNLKTIDSLKG
jgi:uncharacterized protein involved in exopolysaccharide biosynthesis